jgi:hypothetical protein
MLGATADPPWFDGGGSGPVVFGCARVLSRCRRAPRRRDGPDPPKTSSAGERRAAVAAMPATTTRVREIATQDAPELPV